MQERLPDPDSWEERQGQRKQLVPLSGGTTLNVRFGAFQVARVADSTRHSIPELTAQARCNLDRAPVLISQLIEPASQLGQDRNQRVALSSPALAKELGRLEVAHYQRYPVAHIAPVPALTET